MATLQENDIGLEDGKLIVNHFETTRSEIVSYFGNMEESADLGQKLEDALRMGVIASRSVDTVGNVDYVESAFDKMGSDFGRQLDSAFGAGGKFSELLESHFGENGKIVRQFLDSSRDGSPLNILKRDLEVSLAKILTTLAEQEGARRVLKKTVQKGLDFEAQCEERLAEIAKMYGDKLERTGMSPGEMQASKKGDFVITLGKTGRKIVFEMKDRVNNSQNYIEKELSGAMENRGAEYGVFVAKNISTIPKSVGWFNEYNGDRLVCAMENENGDSMMNGEMISLAYRWARTRLDLESKMDVDSEVVKKKVEAIRKKIMELDGIKIQCANIGRATKKITETTESTKARIEEETVGIIESLN